MRLKILANAGASVKWLGAERAVGRLYLVVLLLAIGTDGRPGIIEALAASDAGRDTEKKERPLIYLLQLCHNSSYLKAPRRLYRAVLFLFLL